MACFGWGSFGWLSCDRHLSQICLVIIIIILIIIILIVSFRTQFCPPPFSKMEELEILVNWYIDSSKELELQCSISYHTDNWGWGLGRGHSKPLMSCISETAQ